MNDNTTIDKTALMYINAIVFANPVL